MKTREEVPTTPVALFQADETESDTLPVTGFNVLFQVILGGASLLGGGALFRRSRTA